MRRLRRIGTVLLLGLSLSILAVPQSNAHPTTEFFPECNADGEVVAAYVTAGGNLYEATRKVCVGLYAANPTTHFVVEGVERLRCYRNKVIWDGCRWADSNVEIHWKDSGVNPGPWHLWDTVEWTYPGGTVASTGWRTDSERRFSGHMNEDNDELSRAAGKGGVVRFLLADGTYTNTISMASIWTQQYWGCC
jgi:hypothetical protein